VLPQGKLLYEQKLCGPAFKAGQQWKFGQTASGRYFFIPYCLASDLDTVRKSSPCSSITEVVPSPQDFSGSSTVHITN